MAKIIELEKEFSNIIDQIYIEYKKADKAREKENKAALTIQSWYRGLRIRAYIKYLRENAVKIQKMWRGYLGRRFYRELLQERVREMRLQFYHQKAVIIQKTWRGFYSRKYIFNYYKRKAYLNAIQQKNEIVLKELKEYKEYIERQEEEKKSIKKYQKLEDEAKRNHYLISTKQIPGVFNSPYKPAPNEMEYLMRNVKLNPTEKHEQYVKAIKANKFESITLPEGLPPLSIKPQGPFREPLEVRKQRYRPFSPSLRVETEYDCLEKARKEFKADEWTKRLHDDIFYPVDKTVYKKPYEPLILTKSKYYIPTYGTKQFRDENNRNDIVGERFKTVIPSIPEFHKLNKTYVDAHFYLK